MTDFRINNKYETGFKTWFKNWRFIYCYRSVKASIVALLLLSHLTSLATYTEPTSRTNVNKVDPVFDEKIESYKSFEQALEEQKTSAVKGAESEVGVHDLVDGSDEARAKVSNLSNIRAEELEGAGLRESVREPWINEYLLDYSKPGMMQHKEDAAIIANGTGKMLDGLIGILKKLGIDCKQVKGNKEVEPQYHIQLALELDRNKGDTIYDKIICEELRNKYHCTDTIIVRCVNRAQGGLQPSTIRLGHHEMPDHWWLGRGRDGGRCYGGIQNTTNGFAVFNNIPGVLAEVKQGIIARIGNPNIEVPPQEIMFFQGGNGVSLDGINSSGRVVLYQLNEAGNRGHIQNTWHPNPEQVSGSVRFFYRVTQEAKCIQWHEDWNEVCKRQ
jgi:hypothetical protein